MHSICRRFLILVVFVSSFSCSGEQTRLDVKVDPIYKVNLVHDAKSLDALFEALKASVEETERQYLSYKKQPDLPHPMVEQIVAGFCKKNGRYSACDAIGYNQNITINIALFGSPTEASRHFEFDIRTKRFEEDTAKHNTGGGEYNRYCLSHIDQLGGDLFPMLVWSSFVMFQKRNLVISIFEYSQNRYSWDKNQFIELVGEAFSSSFK